MHHLHHLRWFVLVCLLFIAVSPVEAQGGIIPEPPICRPPCPVPPPPNSTANLYLQSQSVQVQIRNQVAETEVEQVFRNDTPWALEGTYLFPLPIDAAIDSFQMQIDGVDVPGQVLNQREARQIYDEIVRRRIDPALLEYRDRGLFQASIFPIEPGETRRIRLSYSMVLPAESGLIRYAFPLNRGRPIDNLSFNLDIESAEAIKAVYAPNYPVQVERPDDYRALVGWEATQVTPEADFTLYYTVDERELGLNLLSHQPEGEDGFFTMLIAPQIETAAEAVVEKDVVLVLDTSGSMDGEKLSQAQAALTAILDRLNPGDRFNVVRFSTDVTSFAPEIQSLAAADEAQTFVQTLRAEGSTDINLALLESLNFFPRGSDRPAVLIFLTDGLPTSGTTDPNIILNNVRQAAANNVRLFTFGVGDDVDTLLLDELARDLRGSSSYVRPGERVDEQVSAFYARISTPVLADLSLEVEGVTLFETYPDPLPDLFAGTQLLVTGRYVNAGPASVTLRGTVNGQEQRFRYDDLQFRSMPDASFIPRLWATRKVGALLNDIRLNGETEEAVAQIVALSIRYGIITPYTAFLVEEPESALTESGRQAIAAQELEDMAAAEAPRSGAAAVERSVIGNALEAADQLVSGLGAPSGAAAAAGEADEVAALPLQTVGSRAFVQQDGQWVDTRFDETQMTLQTLTYGSDDFFNLLEAYPEAAAYFSLGETVTVVLGGQAYQTVPSDTLPNPAMPPMPRPTDTVGPESTPQTAPELPPGNPTLAPTEVMPNVQTQRLPADEGLIPAPGLAVIAGVFGLLGTLAVGLAGGWLWLRRR